MTNPVYLTTVELLAAAEPGGTLSLEGDEGRHAATVRRTRVGERLDVADGAGRVARCVVREVARDRLTLQIEALDLIAERLPRLVLAQALAKGGRDELAVETATELGVDAVIPWQASRSVSIWAGEKIERGRRRWGSAVREAAKQARRATVPQVEAVVDTAGLVRRVERAGTLTLVLHEGAETLWAAGAWGIAGGESAGLEEIVLVVGPEGGIAEGEVEILVAAGARAVRLGPEVLRTSSAGPAALAVLSMVTGRWG